MNNCGQCKDQMIVDSYEHVQPRIKDHSQKMLSFTGSIMTKISKMGTADNRVFTMRCHVIMKMHS